VLGYRILLELDLMDVGCEDVNWVQLPQIQWWWWILRLHSSGLKHLNTLLLLEKIPVLCRLYLNYFKPVNLNILQITNFTAIW